MSTKHSLSNPSPILGNIRALPFWRVVVSPKAHQGTQPAFQLPGAARRAFYGDISDERARSLLAGRPSGAFICRSHSSNPYVVGVSWKAQPPEEVFTTWFDRRVDSPSNVLPSSNLPHLLAELTDPVDNVAILELFSTIKDLAGFWEFGTNRQAVMELESAGSGFYLIRDHSWDANAVIIYYNDHSVVSPYAAYPSGAGNTWELLVGMGQEYVTLRHLSEVEEVLGGAKPLPEFSMFA